jgi:hypothetical protein
MVSWINDMLPRAAAAITREFSRCLCKKGKEGNAEAIVQWCVDDISLLAYQMLYEPSGEDILIEASQVYPSRKSIPPCRYT